MFPIRFNLDTDDVSDVVSVHNIVLQLSFVEFVPFGVGARSCECRFVCACSERVPVISMFHLERPCSVWSGLIEFLKTVHPTEFEFRDSSLKSNA